MIELGKRVPDDVLACEVLSSAGTKASLGSVVGSGAPVLLVFVRQFVCAGCSERAAELLANEPALVSAGVRVVVVGCGEIAHAKEFEDRLGLAARRLALVTDPTLTVHRAAGLVRSVWGAVGLVATKNLLRAMGKGHANRWGHGDFFQMGGTFLLDDAGTVVAAHTEHHLGATLPLGDVVEKALVLFARRNGAALA